MKEFPGLIQSYGTQLVLIFMILRVIPSEGFRCRRKASSLGHEIFYKTSTIKGGRSRCHKGRTQPSALTATTHMEPTPLFLSYLLLKPMWQDQSLKMTGTCYYSQDLQDPRV